MSAAVFVLYYIAIDRDKSFTFNQDVARILLKLISQYRGIMIIFDINVSDIVTQSAFLVPSVVDAEVFIIHQLQL